jgi:ATP-dependent Clp protease adaptor protein ClpS
MDFVQFVLMKVFHRSTEDALALTLAVHTQGKSIAGTFTFEVAEQKQCEVLLMAKIEEYPCPPAPGDLGLVDIGQARLRQGA